MGLEIQPGAGGLGAGGVGVHIIGSGALVEQCVSSKF